MAGLPKIAVALGDPAGIGPELALKAAGDPCVRAACRPVLVGDPAVVSAHAKAGGIALVLRPIQRFDQAGGDAGEVDVFACAPVGDTPLRFAVSDGAYGRAAVEAARVAVQAAMAGEVDAVVAAPQTEKSIALAGIAFDGYPSFVAAQTGTPVHDVYLMICFDDVRIAHCTLHVGVREALALITPERVQRVIRAVHTSLQRIGIAKPKIYVSGLNPHAGEDGLFGREEIDTIAPAIRAAAASGIEASGPYAADTMFRKPGADAFVVMLHDQGHIAAKLQAFDRAAALSIGTPIMFSSIPQGSAYDIAGQGKANPAAMIAAILRVAGAARP
ncbi:MAG: PdxA family protein [Alphaproteobacteria bacterium]